MGTLYFARVYKTHTLLVMKYAFALAIVLVAVNASPMVQNQQLAQAKAQITEQLTQFYESEGVTNAKNKAKEVSDKIVSIYNDSTLTITEKANKVKEAIASKASNLNKEKLNEVFVTVVAKAQAIYQPWVESSKQWLEGAKGSFNSLLQGWGG